MLLRVLHVVHISSFFCNSLFFFSGLTKLESLNIKWCNCITDADIEPISGSKKLKSPSQIFSTFPNSFFLTTFFTSALANLRSLQICCSRITDFGINYLKGT